MRHLLLFSLLFLIYSNSTSAQSGTDPFDLPSYILKSKNVKSITEFDQDKLTTQFAKYDRSGNQISYSTDSRVIKFDLKYNAEGHIVEEKAAGYKKSILLDKHVVLNQNNQIDSIYHFLPMMMYTGGFIEIFHYTTDQKIKRINVITLSKHRPSYNQYFSYDEHDLLMSVKTYGIDRNDSLNLFNQYYSYHPNKKLKSILKITTNNDTISLKEYNESGTLLIELENEFYTTPSEYICPPQIYADALKDLETPLSTFIFMKNMNRQEFNRNLFSETSYNYKNSNLIHTETILKTKDTSVLFMSTNYDYNHRMLQEKSTTINHLAKDTVTVHVKYSDTSTKLVSLPARSIISFNHIKKQPNKGINLLVDYQYLSWDCKTISHFDEKQNTVTKKRYCMDLPAQTYPDEPEKTTVSKFSVANKMVSQIINDRSNAVPKKISYIYSKQNKLISYEIEGREYWQYEYNLKDSSLIKQTLYKDSLFTDLLCIYSIKYEENGNYSKSLDSVKNEDLKNYIPSILIFNSDGNLTEKKWSESNTLIKFVYNQLGLCIKISSNRDGIKEETHYSYEYY